MKKGVLNKYIMLMMLLIVFSYTGLDTLLGKEVYAVTFDTTAEGFKKEHSCSNPNSTVTTKIQSGNNGTHNKAFYCSCGANTASNYVSCSVNSYSWNNYSTHKKICVCGYSLGTESHVTPVTTRENSVYHETQCFKRTCSTCNGESSWQNHYWQTPEVTKAATCEEAGEQKIKCSMDSRHTKTETIEALGHDYNTEYTVDVAATCTTNGSESQHCKRDGCTSTQNSRTITKKGHNWGSYSSTGSGTSYKHKRTCSRCSEEESGYHSYSTWSDNGNGTHSATCVTCELGKCTENHNWGTPSEENGYYVYRCTANGCTASYSELMHTCSYTVESGVLCTAGTCTAEATYYYKCSCGENPYSSSYTYKGAKDSSNHWGTTEYGGKQYVHTKYTCCGATYSSSHSYTENSGVKYSDATCTASQYNYKKCVCGYNPQSSSYTMSVGKPLGHDRATTWTTNSTHHWKKCSRCNDTTGTDSEYGAHSSDNPATCEVAKKCDKCKVVIEGPLGHLYNGKEEVVTAATCETDGSKTIQCSRTGCTAKDTVTIPKLNHSWPTTYSYNTTQHWQACQNSGCSKKQNTANHGWYETSRINETCTTDGTIYYSCSQTGCSATKTSTINKTDHNYTAVCPTTGCGASNVKCTNINKNNNTICSHVKTHTGFINLSSSSTDIKYGTSSTSFTVSSHHGGTLSASTGKGSASVSSSTVTVSGLGSLSSGTNFTVTVTSGAHTHHTAASANYTIKVINADMSGSVSISGTTTHNNSLTVNTGSINPTGCTLSYQWWYTSTAGATSGTNISGATGTSLTLNSSTYIGKYIGVTVSASKTNYNSKTFTAITSSTISRANISPVITMSGYTYGTTSVPSPSLTSGNPGGGTVTFYYTTSNTNSGGTNWTNVTSGTYLSAGTYYMYATVAQTDCYKAGTSAAVKFVVSAFSASNSNTTLSSISAYTYNTEQHRPTPSVKVTTPSGTYTLSSSSDFTYGYSNNINAGTATVTVTFKGNYTGSASTTFTINKYDLANASIAAIPQNTYTYSGTAKTPTPTVQGPTVPSTGSRLTLTSGTHFTFSYSNNINAGVNTATVTITAKDSNYTGTNSIKFTINKANISPTVSMADYTYGQNSLPTPVVTGNVENGKETYYYSTSNSTTGGTDWTKVTSTTSLPIGTYYMYVVIGTTANYNGATTPTDQFIISPYNLSGRLSISSVGPFTYNTEAHRPKPTVTASTTFAGNITLTEGTHFEYSYANNVNAGTATITITVKENYTGSQSFDFTINKYNLSDAEIAAVPASTYTYDSGAKTPEPKVEGPTVPSRNTRLVLTKNNEFTYSYNNNVNAGTNTASVTITAKDSNYTGSQTLYFTINPYNLVNASIAEIPDSTYTYDGTAKKPTPEVLGPTNPNTNTRLILTAGNEINYSYTNNVQAGIKTATVTITPASTNYTGSNSIKFTINKAAIHPTVVMDDYTYGQDGLPVPDTLGNIENGKETYYYSTVNSNSGGRNWTEVTSTTYLDIGTYYMYVVVNTTTNYLGATSPAVEFVISPYNLTGKMSISSVGPFIYNTEAFEPRPTVTAHTTFGGDIVLTPEVQFDYSYKDNINAGTATITITAKENYTGSQSYNFTINPYDLANTEIAEIPKETYTYDGTEKKPEPVVQGPTVPSTGNRHVLVKGTEFTYSYKDNIEAGVQTAVVIITPVSSNYTGTNSINFTINKANINPTISMDDYTYGDPILPTPVIEGNIENGTETIYYLTTNTNVGGTNWTKVTDTTYLSAGTYYMYAEIGFTVNYNGAKTNVTEFTVYPYDLTGKLSIAEIVGLVYNTEPQEPKPNVTALNIFSGNTELTEGVEFSYSYENNINAGTGKITLTGINNYIGSQTFEFTINPFDLANAIIAEIPDETYTYDGTEKKPEPVVQGPIVPSINERIVLTKNVEFTYSYENNINAGVKTAVVKITANHSNYTGTNFIRFTINKATITPEVLMEDYMFGGAELPDPSVIGNHGNGEVTYYYNTTNKNSDGTDWVNVKDTIYLPASRYYMYAYIAESNNYLEATTPTTIFRVGQTALMTVNSDLTWRQSHTAEVTIYDPDKDLVDMAEHKFLKEGTIRIYYVWNQSQTTPSTFSTDKYVDVKVGANVSEVVARITRSEGNGLWYLHAKATILDAMDYEAERVASSASGFRFDNTKPLIEILSPAGTTYYTEKDNIEVILKVTDYHSEVNASDEITNFTKDDILVYVAGVSATCDKTLTRTSYDSTQGIGMYSLILSNVKGTGYITLDIPAGQVKDNAENENDATHFAISDIRAFVDNFAPVVVIDESDPDRKGNIIVELPTEKIDLDDPKDEIDPRYINKEYQINIPFVVTEVGSGVASNNLSVSNINVFVNETEVAPENKEMRDVGVVESTEPVTLITTYARRYELVLKGLTGDGYLTVKMGTNVITDNVGNYNSENVIEPFGTHDEVQRRVFVDNTKPTLLLVENNNEHAATKNDELEFKLKVIDNGSGITERQFVSGDILPQVYGTTIPATVIVEKDLANDYNSELGNSVEANYTYVIKLKGIEENGILRIRIPRNTIIDKANNGIEPSTIPANVIIDNEGPTVGIIKTNADEYGRITDDITELSIDNCTDSSGIGKYEWQVSKDGVNWQTISIDNSSLSTSHATHQSEQEGKIYYRVKVSDSLGNTTISDVVEVIIIKSLNRKPTIRLSTNQLDVGKVEIIATVKASSDIVKITVNNLEIDEASWRVTRRNTEVTVVASYVAISNGDYVVVAEDARGNTVSEKINVNMIKSDSSTIRYEITNATISSEAKITFISKEPIKVVDPNRYYPDIKFDITDSYLTKLTARITRGADYDEDKTFTFVNIGMIESDVVVPAPIITDVAYVRFTQNISTSLNITLGRAKSLASGMKSSQVVIDGQNKSYYGFDSTGIVAEVADTNALESAITLGSASKTYVITQSGKKDELESTATMHPVTNSSFVNGNVTGMTNKSGGLLEYDGVSDSGASYTTFRATLGK